MSDKNKIYESEKNRPPTNPNESTIKYMFDKNGEMAYMSENIALEIITTFLAPNLFTKADTKGPLFVEGWINSF